MVVRNRVLHIYRVRFRSERLRAVVAWTCLVAFILASQGIAPRGLMPSPALLARIGLPAAAEERFPCEGCACGCGTAEHCWTSCCCHTLEERVDWAIANNVALPKSVAQGAYKLLMARAVAAQLPACCAVHAADGGGNDACHGACHASTDAARMLAVRMATMSPLGCKGVSSWGAASLPLLPSAFIAVKLPRASPPSFDAPTSDAVPAGLAIESPSPPPRA